MNDINNVDITSRIKSFNEELGALQTKYNLTLLAEPLIFQGRIVAKPIVMDSTDFNKQQEAVKNEQPAAENK